MVVAVLGYHLIGGKRELTEGGGRDRIYIDIDTDMGREEEE